MDLAHKLSSFDSQRSLGFQQYKDQRSSSMDRGLRQFPDLCRPAVSAEFYNLLNLYCYLQEYQLYQ